MPRVTKATLEVTNMMLRGDIQDLRHRNELLEVENRMALQQLETLQRYISTMIVGSEKLADALSHTVGLLNEPKRLQAMTQHVQAMTQHRHTRE